MMQAGDYYIGDLCYVLHEVWDEVCDLMFKDKISFADGEFTLKDGRRFAIYNTAYGDGTYRDQNRNQYSVDAGSIGCILLSDIDLNAKAPWGGTNDIGGGNIVTFTREFDTDYIDGLIRFGHIEIDTDPDYYDNEYDGQPDEAQEWHDYDPEC
jgi:hypothetical protein